MTAPSIEAVSGLVSRLRQRAVAILTVRKVPTPIQRHDAALDNEAADALEAQARELAERDKWVTYWQTKCQATRTLQLEAQARISALEDAVRVKDEALKPFAKAADEMEQSYTIPLRDDWCTPNGWLSLGECRRARTARTALSNGEPHDR